MGRPPTEGPWPRGHHRPPDPTVTFALGTAAGDYLAESLAIGYWKSALIFGGAIAVIALAHFRLRLDAILAFWLAYISPARSEPRSATTSRSRSPTAASAGGRR